ncbi:MAG: rhomboid family intramembrane serine protease [Bacilli bacterium]|jgi:rhomboid protease GluP
MTQLTIDQKNELVMKLLHYFITVEGYNPIVLHGAENELWLENLDNPYKIVRIVSNYIHNNEQYNFDLFKTKKILDMIKRKTFSLKMRILNIFIDLGENVDLESTSFADCIYIKNEADFSKYHFVIEQFPAIINKLKHDESGINLFLKITNDINKKNEIDIKKTNELFMPKRAYITYLLITINIFMFMVLELFGEGSNNVLTLLQNGALYPPLVREGDYYRLITCAFLHIGLLHLLFNCYALYVIGSQIESFYGKAKYIIIYLFSALIGSLMSMLFTDAISAGASGAIFGLLGALLYFGYHYRIYLGNVMRSQIIPLIIFNLMLGFILVGIDNAAHIGGLMGGILISMALGIKEKTSLTDRINGTIMSIIFLLFIIYMAFVYAT